ncbi:MAG: anhydro-N-acetylmuramic acid kinase [Ramlibacter sp.]|nr:anhydro-N-acetylmuramic acid kinase [Ramlibacter sp.]
MKELYVGLMSGTSLDGVDGVLADFSGPAPRCLVHASRPLEAPLRSSLLALNRPGHNELHDAALAANALVRVYAAVVKDLLVEAGVPAPTVNAIGAHGQTVRHQPQAFDGTGYTLQLNHPALLAELTGIDVVADFRSRDVAAGGQGAPLAPFFHEAVFTQPDQQVGVLNLGGIANLTLLDPQGLLGGFDCGPANALMDHWCERHTGQPFDRNGAWAASGTVQARLLQALLAHPYFELAPPKSTGRDLFNQEWLDHALGVQGHLLPVDVQATLAELTARTCAQALLDHAPQAGELVVCGGGALNQHLMQRLQALLPGQKVLSSEERGPPPQQVEAAAFAWLARKTVRRETLDLRSTTGARGARVLGAIYPA